MSVIVEEIAAKFGLESDEQAFSKVDAILRNLHKADQPPDAGQ